MDLGADGLLGGGVEGHRRRTLPDARAEVCAGLEGDLLMHRQRLGRGGVRLPLEAEDNGVPVLDQHRGRVCRAGLLIGWGRNDGCEVVSAVNKGRVDQPCLLSALDVGEGPAVEQYGDGFSVGLNILRVARVRHVRLFDKRRLRIYPRDGGRSSKEKAGCRNPCTCRPSSYMLPYMLPKHNSFLLAFDGSKLNVPLLNSCALRNAVFTSRRSYSQMTERLGRPG